MLSAKAFPSCVEASKPLSLRVSHRPAADPPWMKHVMATVSSQGEDGNCQLNRRWSCLNKRRDSRCYYPATLAHVSCRQTLNATAREAR